MTEEERRTAQLLKAEFESSGIHLPAAEREEVRALLNEITALETEFGSNVIMKRTGFQVAEAELAEQLPPDVIRSVVLPHQPPHQPPGVQTLTTDAAVSNAVLRCVRFWVCVPACVRACVYEEHSPSGGGGTEFDPIPPHPTTSKNRYARDGELRRRMYQEVNTGPVENLDVLERLIQVGAFEEVTCEGPDSM